MPIPGETYGMDPNKRVGSQKCWSCGSLRYVQTIIREYCPDCKIECNYHGGGANDRYDMAMAARHEEDERRQREAEQDDFD